MTDRRERRARPPPCARSPACCGPTAARSVRRPSHPPHPRPRDRIWASPRPPRGGRSSDADRLGEPEHGGVLLGKDRQAIETNRARVYELFPGWPSKGQLGGTSGGEQQMLAIGRADGPAQLPCSTALAGAGPTAGPRDLETVQAINEQGVTVLLVEQNARAALRHGGLRVRVETGTIALEGPAAELLDNERPPRLPGRRARGPCPGSGCGISPPSRARSSWRR